MRIISEARLREFWLAARGDERIAREKAMKDWRSVVRRAEWHDFSDVRQTFNHADVFKNCTIFDVGGNKYRVIAKIAYRAQIVYIRSVMTHKEYDAKAWCGDCK